MVIKSKLSRTLLVLVGPVALVVFGLMAFASWEYIASIWSSASVLAFWIFSIQGFLWFSVVQILAAALGIGWHKGQGWKMFDGNAFVISIRKGKLMAGAETAFNAATVVTLCATAICFFCMLIWAFSAFMEGLGP